MLKGKVLIIAGIVLIVLAWVFLAISPTLQRFTFVPALMISVGAGIIVWGIVERKEARIRAAEVLQEEKPA